LEYKNVRLVKGKLPDTLEEVKFEKIAFLHIDLNAPDIEIDCLKKLWDRILPGGVVLIDDYAYYGFEYTTKLFNKLAEELGVSILTTASGQGIIVK
jgi:predicted O-methyltransferase YrrM